MSLTQTDGRQRLPTVAFTASALLSVVTLFLPEAPGAEVSVPGLDKVVHALLFALLAVTARWRFGPRRVVPVALLLYAGGSELAQAVLLPNRSGDLLDVAADLTGVVLGLLGADAWRRSRPGSVTDDIRS
ncbi:MAG TPA: VanZ family protein [Mycobacteriales bacterium]|nr:VanZ family protein [Mycobacteriales bacterium]